MRNRGIERNPVPLHVVNIWLSHIILFMFGAMNISMKKSFYIVDNFWEFCYSIEYKHIGFQLVSIYAIDVNWLERVGVASISLIRLC